MQSCDSSWSFLVHRFAREPFSRTPGPSLLLALERKIWATPARTLADVLLRGEMALYNENGIMESLDDTDAYYDERSVAQLIRAVVDVLGGLYAR